MAKPPSVAATAAAISQVTSQLFGDSARLATPAAANPTVPMKTAPQPGTAEKRPPFSMAERTKLRSAAARSESERSRGLRDSGGIMSPTYAGTPKRQALCVVKFQAPKRGLSAPGGGIGAPTVRPSTAIDKSG